jgi:hypothetical protein
VVGDAGSVVWVAVDEDLDILTLWFCRFPCVAPDGLDLAFLFSKKVLSPTSSTLTHWKIIESLFRSAFFHTYSTNENQRGGG